MDSDFSNTDKTSTEENKETLILGKFKSQADFEEGYRGLEGEFTKRSQELADLKRTLEELQTRQTTVNTQVAEPEDEDEDQLFFQAPSKATEKVISKAMAPVYEFLYAQQKETFRSDPLFVKYEKEVDAIANMKPEVKTQAGSVAQIFKMVKGLHLEDLEEQLRAKIKTEMENKQTGSLEGASSSTDTNTANTKDVSLTEDEKKVAIRFNRGMPAEEAYKKYADKKARCGGAND